MDFGAKKKVGGKVIGCSLSLGYFLMKANVYAMILGYCDFMIGMDWLESHVAILKCKTKWSSLVDNEGQRCVIVGRNEGFSLRFISSLSLSKRMC